jgi:hypothetical protein
LELSGEIARIRKDRYIIPKEADLFTGVIQFHLNGGAHVLNEKLGGADLFIRPENTSTAMNGARPVARVASSGFSRGQMTPSSERFNGQRSFSMSWRMIRGSQATSMFCRPSRRWMRKSATRSWRSSMPGKILMRILRGI